MLEDRSESVALCEHRVRPRLVYRGQPVMTFRGIGEIHDEWPEGTAKRLFEKHRAQLRDGEEYFEVEAAKLPKDITGGRTPIKGRVILLSQCGYLYLVNQRLFEEIEGVRNEYTQ